jgi:large repetitive protein
MKRIAFLAPALAAGASLVLAACAGDVAAPAAPVAADRALAPTTASFSAAPVAAEAIPGEYVVVLKHGVTSLGGIAGNMVAAHNGRLRHVYSAALNGFSATLSDSGAE